MTPWIKAGLIVGVLQILFTLPTLTIFYFPLEISVPISYVACCLFTFLYLLPGILDVHWSIEPREQNEILKSGALAGFLASTIDGIASFLLILLVSISGSMEKYLQETLSTEMEILNQAGFDSVFFIVLVLIQTCIGLIFHILTGVIISPVGGLIYAGIKHKKK